jgi:hypothetical protein
VKPSAAPIASRAASATSTVPGRATPVTRLATLTGLPNQYPLRLILASDKYLGLLHGVQVDRASSRCLLS